MGAKDTKAQKAFGKNGVFYSFQPGNDEQIQIVVDFAQVPVPNNYAYADALHLHIDNQLRVATLSFGRREDKTNRFCDRIDIVMPMKSLLETFWASARPVEATLDKLLEVSGFTGEMPEAASPETEGVTMFANMIFLAVGDGESTLDFYHLPPREVHLAKTQKKDMQLEPVVRIIIATPTTKYFFNTLRRYAEKSLESVPQLERSEHATRIG